MALTTCPDCGRQVSTEAAACPGCGRPMATTTRPPFAAQTMDTLAPRNRSTYIILGVLLGGLGIHNFYAKHYARGAVQLAITATLGWVFGIGLVITFVCVLVDLFSVTSDGAGNAFA